MVIPFLYSKGDDRALRVIYQIFTDTSIKKVRQPFAAVRRHTHQLRVHFLSKIQNTFLYRMIVVNVQAVIL